MNIESELKRTVADDKHDDLFLEPEKNVSKKRKSSDTFISNKSTPHFKRRYSQPGSRGRGKTPVLPTKFLLGGNINDPLNLNSMCDDAINKALNEKTPQSSPLPTPVHRQQVHVLIPPNIKDPLNLNSQDDADPKLMSPKILGKKKKRHKKKKSANDVSIDEKDNDCLVNEEPLKIMIPECNDLNIGSSSKLSSVLDEIVSPVIPQTSPKWKRKNNVPDSKSHKNDMDERNVNEKIKSSKHQNSPILKIKKSLPLSSASQNLPKKKTFRSKDQYFEHGNYNCYYGKRSPGEEMDYRLQCFHKDWFDHRDVLDIGCNIGHVTLCIARDYQPKHIVGLDIDGKLIGIAKKNIRHYISRSSSAKKYPISFGMTYGPMAAPPLPIGDCGNFPNNVSFVQGNYVLENDELLENVREEYDCILALSISKWVHLNNGDGGLKRFFKRVFRNLRPGGKFILEPQSWSSYKKKKKITERIFHHYQNIHFRPEQFTEYLLSREIGFITCNKIDLPFDKSKGFQRPILVFTKPDTSSMAPQEGSGETPRLMDIYCTPSHSHYSRDATPRYCGYTPSSGRATPSYAMWSANATPHIDRDASPPPLPHSQQTQLSNTDDVCMPGCDTFNDAQLSSCATIRHKYTFISGDPRTPPYMHDAGDTPTHSTTAADEQSPSSSATETTVTTEQKTVVAVDNSLVTADENGYTATDIDGQQSVVECRQSPVERDSGQPPVETDSGQPPVERDSGQPPVERDSGQPPVERDSGQPPVERDSGQPPVETDSGQPPVERDSGQPPVETDSGQPPVETDWTGANPGL